MIKITINNREVEAEEGSMLLEVSVGAGFPIPAMCYNGQEEHFTSCMICLVKERTTGKLLPSCSVRVAPGMDIVTEDDEIRTARKTALELLLSEHVGDCEAPCRIACPAFMDIPRMNRLIAAGQVQQALEVVRRDIALPAVLGRICPAPCEGACKRRPIDQPVAICLLKRFTADESGPLMLPETATTGKKVAIIGAGPAGLSAAFYLQQKGIQAVIFDRNPLPGGSLQYEIPDEKLDKSVLAGEISLIRQTGVQFRPDQLIDATAFERLRRDYDAVVVATGNHSAALDSWGIEHNGKQLQADKSTHQTGLEGVFAIGNANRPGKLAIRSAAQGKEVAKSIEQLFSGEPVRGETRRFNSSFGRLMEEEFPEYLKEGSPDKRQQARGKPGNGFDPDQARMEAARCMHCDCRKPDHCKLRDYAGMYKASRRRFSYSSRKPVRKFMQDEGVVYEPGKCIKCGICVRLTARHQETFGFTFIGRGFDVEIGVPFNETLDKALVKTAQAVALACPTGALCFSKNSI
ncbi:MAG: FAD-dependent oxidoreductase [Bacteroidales bacterium]